MILHIQEDGPMGHVLTYDTIYSVWQSFWNAQLVPHQQNKRPWSNRPELSFALHNLRVKSRVIVRTVQQASLRENFQPPPLHKDRYLRNSLRIYHQDQHNHNTAFDSFRSVRTVAILVVCYQKNKAVKWRHILQLQRFSPRCCFSILYVLDFVLLASKLQCCIMMGRMWACLSFTSIHAPHMDAALFKMSWQAVFTSKFPRPVALILSFIRTNPPHHRCNYRIQTACQGIVSPLMPWSTQQALYDDESFTKHEKPADELTYNSNSYLEDSFHCIRQQTWLRN